MKLKKRVLLATISIVVLCAVWYFGARFGRAQLASQDVGFNAIFASTLLETIRSGNTNNTVRLLEASLDSNVYAISVWRRQAGSRAYREQMREGLMMAARYRERYPRMSSWVPLSFNPMVDGADKSATEKVQLACDDYNAVIDALLQEGRQLLLEQEKLESPTFFIFMRRFLSCQKIIGDDEDVYELTDWQGKVHSLHVGDVVQGFTLKGSETRTTSSGTVTDIVFKTPRGEARRAIDRVIDGQHDTTTH